MAELLTAAEMRAAERAAIDSGAVTGLVLMERAGRGVVEAVLDWRPELARTAHRAVVLCGPGNNGGDGFVVARLLAERGWTVEVFLFGDAAKLPPDAAENCRRWREMGEIRAYSDAQTAWEPGRRDPVDLFVDALFGTGLSRPLAGVDQFAAFTERAVLDARSQKDRRTWPETTVVAIDVPSGL
ncbi:MAG: NAD(P)H-hydrate epimerase, partial [Pseudomonadota bacterium]